MPSWRPHRQPWEAAAAPIPGADKRMVSVASEGIGALPPLAEAQEWRQALAVGYRRAAARLLLQQV